MGRPPWQDIVLPLVTTLSCFDDSVVPPFEGAMNPKRCRDRSCRVGDFYALYSIYALVKILVCTADVLLNTRTMARKPGEWYRMRRIG